MRPYGTKRHLREIGTEPNEHLGEMGTRANRYRRKISRLFGANGCRWKRALEQMSTGTNGHLEQNG